MATKKTEEKQYLAVDEENWDFYKGSFHELKKLIGNDNRDMEEFQFYDITNITPKTVEVDYKLV